MFRKYYSFIKKCTSRTLIYHPAISCHYSRRSPFKNPCIVFARRYCQNQKEDDKSTNKAENKELDDFEKIPQKRNFITPLRAMNEYLLRPSDLQGLRKIHRRSPFYNSPPIVVYLRSDVEKKALEVWGNLETLQKEQRIKNKANTENLEGFEIERFLEDYNRSGYEEGKAEEALKQKQLKGSTKVVRTAIAINGLNFAFKTTAWLYSGSYSMFAEAIHSFADTLNQIILAFGIKLSTQQANFAHPYGFHNIRYVTSLISGVGIFFLGTGLSYYHGIYGLIHPHQIENIVWAYFVLGGSLISEGGTLIVAYNEVRKAAKQENTSIFQYVLLGQDPSINVVLLEDLAAVLGVFVAGSCMFLSSLYNNPAIDSIGSLLVGSILGIVASFIVYSNSAALAGKSIPVHRIMKISRDLENDLMVRAIHDVKATDMGNAFVRFKAEIDFDGRELTRAYLNGQNAALLLEEIKRMKTEKDVEKFILKHGENIVDMLGAEIDRIEKEIKKKYPEVRHVDLEVL